MPRQRTPAPPGLKTCRRCDAAKPLEAFHASARSTDGRGSRCADCVRVLNEAQRHKRRANGKATAYDRERHRALYASVVLRRFGMTLADYDRLLAQQGGGCAVCGATADPERSRHGHPKALALDHDHNTGRVRGLLCGSCNKGLGHFHDRVDLLEAAARYLTLFSQSSAFRKSPDANTPC